MSRNPYESAAIAEEANVAQPAPLGRRMAAAILDLAAVSTASLLAAAIPVYLAEPIVRASGTGMMFLGPQYLGLVVIPLVAVPPAYHIGSLALFSATPGKRVCHLRVTRRSGSIGVGIAVVRYFVSWFSLVCLGGGYLMALFDDQRRTLHDRIAGTVVVDAGAGQGSGAA